MSATVEKAESSGRGVRVPDGSTISGVGEEPSAAVSAEEVLCCGGVVLSPRPATDGRGMGESVIDLDWKEPETPRGGICCKGGVPTYEPAAAAEPGRDGTVREALPTGGILRGDAMVS